MNLGNYLVEFMIITVHGMQLVQLPTDESAGSVTVCCISVRSWPREG